MDKPTANDNAVSKTNENNRKSHKRDDLSLNGTPEMKESHFPDIKYYHGSDFSLIKVQKTIESAGLIEFLESLGISSDIAKYYFYEVHVYNKNTHEKLRTLGFHNEDDGFELISPFFKGTIGSQTVSFIRSSTPKPESIHIFNDSLDFLSFLSKIGGKKILADTIILHSLTCLEQIKPYIQNYGYKQAYSWMSNDIEGFQAKDFIQQFVETEESLKHKAMNKLYKPFKDLKTWYQQEVRNAE